MTAGMIRAARARQALCERPTPASGSPITTTMRLDQLAPLATDDRAELFEEGILDEVAFSTLASLVLATPQSTTVATPTVEPSLPPLAPFASPSHVLSPPKKKMGANLSRMKCRR